jgi:lysozyme
VRRKLRIPVAALGAVLGAGIACLLLCLLLLGEGDDSPLPSDLTLPCGGRPAVQGIDVSHHQDTVAWRRVRQAGIQFAFIRVSDGMTVSDPRFAQHWIGARRAGILRGAYQYFRPEESPIAQADLLIAAIRRDAGELPPVIDVEIDSGMPPAQLEARVRAWIERVRAQLRIEPIVYTGPAFWRDRVGGADLSSQPLWLAHYTQSCPTVPEPWARWTFWQHTDRGVVPGIEGTVDLNLFDGDALALEELARRSRVPELASATR